MSSGEALRTRNSRARPRRQACTERRSSAARGRSRCALDRTQQADPPRAKRSQVRRSAEGEPGEYAGQLGQ